MSPPVADGVEEARLAPGRRSAPASAGLGRCPSQPPRRSYGVNSTSRLRTWSPSAVRIVGSSTDGTLTSTIGRSATSPAPRPRAPRRCRRRTAAACSSPAGLDAEALGQAGRPRREPRRRRAPRRRPSTRSRRATGRPADQPGDATRAERRRATRPRRRGGRRRRRRAWRRAPRSPRPERTVTDRTEPPATSIRSTLAPGADAGARRRGGGGDGVGQGAAAADRPARRHGVLHRVARRAEPGARAVRRHAPHRRAGGDGGRRRRAEVK